MSEDNKTLNEIVSVLISERKRDYRNKIIFRILIFLIFVSLLFIAPMAKDINFTQPHIAVIEVNGLIASKVNRVLRILYLYSSEQVITKIHR